MENPKPKYEPQPEDYPHPKDYPRGAKILSEGFYWDCTDEFSPFGNDDGADTLEAFVEWREEHPRANPLKFLEQFLKEWDVKNDYWEVVDASKALALLEQDEFSFTTRDNCLIAVAFGQILVDGKVAPELKRRALLAIERRLLPQVSEKLFGQGHRAEATEKLGKMKAVLRDLTV